MKLAVTGGNGFFGSNFINCVLKKHEKCEILNIDNKRNNAASSGSGNIKTIVADITDYHKILRVLRGVDYVVHFAGVSLIKNNCIPPLSYTTQNVLGTHNVLEAARKNRVKKFILISSCEVHRNDIYDFVSPKNVYAASKLGAEAVLISYYNTYDFPALIVRPTNLFGPFQTPDRIISSFIVALLAGRKITVRSDGNRKRDYLYVEDACEAVYQVLLNGEPGTLYNLSGGASMSNYTLARKLLRYFKGDESRIKITADGNAGNNFRLPKDRKLNKLGWKKMYSFDSALKKTIAWYKENRGLYE
jgi:dTDP-glucose 4,6-dehydratase